MMPRGRRLSRILAWGALLLLPVLAGCLGGGQAQSMACRFPDADLAVPEVRWDGADHMVDDLGIRVNISDTSRLLVTSHDLTELVYLFGAEDRLVARPMWIDWPPGIEDVQPIGGILNIGREEVAGQEPSLVLNKNSPLQTQDLSSLNDVGVPTYTIEGEGGLDDHLRTVAVVGAVLGMPERAQELIDDFQAKIDALAALHPGSDCQRAYYLLPGRLTGGIGTDIDLSLRAAGLENVAAAAGLTGHKQLSPEPLLVQDPEVVLVSWTAHLDPADVAGFRFLDGTSAAASETVHVVDPAITTMMGPRFPDGAYTLARMLRPEAFDDPRADFTWSLDGPNLTVSADVPDATAYQWYFGDKQAVKQGGTGRHPFATGPTAEYTLPGRAPDHEGYRVTLFVTRDDGFTEQVMRFVPYAGEH